MNTQSVIVLLVLLSMVCVAFCNPFSKAIDKVEDKAQDKMEEEAKEALMSMLKKAFWKMIGMYNNETNCWRFRFSNLISKFTNKSISMFLFVSGWD